MRRQAIARGENPDEEPTKEQKQAVKMLCDGEKMCKVSRKLGVHRTTIWRWLQRYNVQKFKDGYEGYKLEKQVREWERQLDSPDMEKRLEVSNRILDLAGIGNNLGELRRNRLTPSPRGAACKRAAK